LPSYIQDTTDFINKLNSIEQKLPGDSILFCMDVKGLQWSILFVHLWIAFYRALANISWEHVLFYVICDVIFFPQLTENIAEFAEKELEQHVRTLPSYIQDTTDFINKLNSIEQKLPGDSILFCMDVLKRFISKRPQKRRLRCM
jgi:uncharacterized protein YfaT (DUF1175 family)